jgi:hypothetical protein
VPPSCASLTNDTLEVNAGTLVVVVEAVVVVVLEALGAVVAELWERWAAVDTVRPVPESQPDTSSGTTSTRHVHREGRR